MKKRTKLNKKLYSATLKVRKRPYTRTQGFINIGRKTIKCTLGEAGIGIAKKEGDGKTPVGKFEMLEIYKRIDAKPMTERSRCGIIPIHEKQGWCDAVGDRNYNKPVKLPYKASCEKMMREDELYDVVVVLDYNIRRKMKRGGSAIFFHIANEEYKPTKGCVGVSKADMQYLLKHMDKKCTMVVEG